MKNAKTILISLCLILLALNLGIFIGKRDYDGTITTHVEKHENKEKLLDINTAKYSDLYIIPDLSPAMARKIVDYRDEFGPYKDIYDLLNIQGFTYNLLEDITDYIYIAK